MTDDSHSNGPRDGLGEAPDGTYPTEDTAGSAVFDDPDPTDTTKCHACGYRKPAGEDCPTCGASGRDESKRSTKGSAPSTVGTNWKQNRVIFALVPGSVKDAALARATSAFKVRDVPFTITETLSKKDSFELIDDLDGETTALFKRKWGELSNAVPVDSDRGTALIEAIKDNTDWEVLPDAADTPASGPYVYTENGNPITGEDAFEERLESQDTLWLVPAVAKRPSTTSRNEYLAKHPEATKEASLVCPSCNEETHHRFQRVEYQETVGQKMGRWKCTSCRTKHWAQRPENLPSQA